MASSRRRPPSPARTASPTTVDGQSPPGQKPASDPLHPVVVIETSLGNITVRLDAEKAPLTVDNFLSYVGAGQYDQTIVHQVYKGQGFLAGGYGTNLVEKPGRTPVRNEAHNGLKNRRGTIAMVRLPDAIDSATCQFFINVADNPALDLQGSHARRIRLLCVRRGRRRNGRRRQDRQCPGPRHGATSSERRCRPSSSSRSGGSASTADFLPAAAFRAAAWLCCSRANNSATV